MGTQQDSGLTQILEFIMIYGLETELLQAAAFYAVVYYVTQAIEFIAFAQFLLSLTDGREHSKAESGFIVNLNTHRGQSFAALR